jgi:hypothetical protein
MNENKLSRVVLSRVVLNNHTCRLCGAAHAARTCIRMASEQGEEEEQVSGEWRRTRYRHSIGFLGHGQLSHPIAGSARATSVSLCARPVSLCESSKRRNNAELSVAARRWLFSARGRSPNLENDANPRVREKKNVNRVGPKKKLGNVTPAFFFGQPRLTFFFSWVASFSRFGRRRGPPLRSGPALPRAEYNQRRAATDNSALLRPFEDSAAAAAARVIYACVRRERVCVGAQPSVERKGPINSLSSSPPLRTDSVAAGVYYKAVRVWGRGIVEDMCYERRRAEACVD